MRAHGELDWHSNSNNTLRSRSLSLNGGGSRTQVGKTGLSQDPMDLDWIDLVTRKRSGYSPLFSFRK